MSTTIETCTPMVVQWGDYEIAVRVGAGTSRQSAGGVTAVYEIFKAKRLLAVGQVPATYPSASIAAESALRIAKLDARESFGGDLPAY